ncbi:Vesicle-associated membrane-protein-associated protein [Trema orientale]|uniref:Vesicle-associated membrane-protein-associated protein n=1 Tax=Trema orientale TaxID=63057 RepID=A0A2P5E8Q7_TREOI|nr:Vesicle-associated membrane-protein-associated protein [Trema orientale]
MAVEAEKSGSDGKVWRFCKMPFWQGRNGSSSSSSSLTSMHNNAHQQNQSHQSVEHMSLQSSTTVSSVAKSFLPTRRRLRLDPPNKLFFPYEPGKQVRSAIGIKNTCKSHVAFKFQTTAPKSCYMRPPGGILAPGESLIATVFKFVEPPENNEKPIDQKSKVKFKIMSLKVKGEMDYVPELFDEQKDQVAVEQILRVIFLDPERPTPALEKLKRQLAEAEAALEARKKPPEDTGPRIVGEGLVIDEWKERRERYLARQQVEGVDSV